jgi:hypothetical protein
MPQIVGRKCRELGGSHHMLEQIPIPSLIGLRNKAAIAAREELIRFRYVGGYRFCFHKLEKFTQG